MMSITRKLIAVLMVLWLPLSSGSALAASVAMQAGAGHCAPTAMMEEHQSHLVSSHDHSTPAQHMSHAAHHEVQAYDSGQELPQDPSCKNCGVCHLACCGYLAAEAGAVMQLLVAGQAFTMISTSFQSVSFAPLDPPPLTRA